VKTPPIGGGMTDASYAAALKGFSLRQAIIDYDLNAPAKTLAPVILALAQAARPPFGIFPCSVMGGRSPKTGRPVGSRHRWSGGQWGRGMCLFCFKSLEQCARPAEHGT